jgi:hypothetical protein|tara:strand:- start:153 stop:488 length:336 start_codon:yes stop_codon:yes gene_type:complete
MKIKTQNENKGLFSDKKYKINEKIHKLAGVIYDQPSRTTIEIAKNSHIDDPYGIYMNHSFLPNCAIKDGYILSICNIDEDDELTFNYNENETVMACPFIDNATKQHVNGKE